MSAPATATPRGSNGEPSIDVKCPPCGWSGKTPDLLIDDSGPMIWCPQCRRATWVWADKQSRNKARDAGDRFASEFRRASIAATTEINRVECRLRLLGINVESFLDVDYGTYDAYAIQWRLVQDGVKKKWRLIYWSKTEKGKPLMECSAAIRVQCAPRLKELEEKAIGEVKAMRGAMR